MSSSFSGDDPPFVLPGYATQHQKGKRKNAAKRGLTPDRDDHTLVHELWSEKYSPKDVEQVAVMPQKKKEVKACLEQSALKGPKGRYKCLVLSGPAGCGKSTLIRLLGSSLGYSIIEYSNSVSSSKWESSSLMDGYESEIDKFENFLTNAMSLSALGSSNESGRPRIILLDDIPDLTTNYIKSRFHQLLTNCISVKGPFLLVIVISDAWMDIGARRQYSMDTMLSNKIDIVPAEVLQSPLCATIQFNPITPVRLRKALEQINSCEVMSMNRGVSRDKISQIVELSQGDIRNAINALQFFSIPALPTQTIPAKRKLGSDDDAGRNHKAVIGDIAAKDTSLSLFHAVGKVLYRKRTEQGDLESKAEYILDNLPTDSNTFLAYLQQNYTSFADDIFQCARASNWIAEADVLGASGAWQDTAPAAYQALVAMHGIMQIPPASSRRFYQMQKPPYISSSVVKSELSTLKPKVPLTAKAAAGEGLSEHDPVHWNDEIQSDFSEDEYDGIFGEGDDLAALDVCP